MLKAVAVVAETVKEMVAYTIMAIDWETALGQDAGDNVRQLKVGCRLTTLLAHFSIESLQELLVGWLIFTYITCHEVSPNIRHALLMKDTSSMFITRFDNDPPNIIKRNPHRPHPKYNA